MYNRTVTNTVINNVTINNTTINRASYNGPGGVTRQSVPAEIAAMHEQRIPPMSTQLQQQQAAAQNGSLPPPTTGVRPFLQRRSQSR